MLGKQYPTKTGRIGGHTDSDPIRNSNDGYPTDTLELSFKRADAVMDFLRTNGMSDQRMYVAAYGETRPRVPNTSKNNKAMNRRVEIVVMPDLKFRAETLEVSKK